MQTTNLSLRERLRRNLTTTAVAATDMLLFVSAPHVHPMPNFVRITPDRYNHRARAMAQTHTINPYQGIKCYEQ